MKKAKKFLKDKNIVEGRDREIIEGWCEEFAQHVIDEKMPSDEEKEKWYDFLAGKGLIAQDIACFITDTTRYKSQLKDKGDEK